MLKVFYPIIFFILNCLKGMIDKVIYQSVVRGGAIMKSQRSLGIIITGITLSMMVVACDPALVSQTNGVDLI